MQQAPAPPNMAPQRAAMAPNGLAPQNVSLPVANSPAANLPASGAFLFDPSTLNLAKGSTFTVNVMMTGGKNVYEVPVQLNYDPNQLSVVNVSNGGFLSQDGQAVALVHRDDPQTGTLQVTASRPPGVGGISVQGAVVTLTFMPQASGQSALTITRGGAYDPNMLPISMNGAQAAITIQK